MSGWLAVSDATISVGEKAAAQLYVLNQPSFQAVDAVVSKVATVSLKRLTQRHGRLDSHGASADVKDRRDIRV